MADASTDTTALRAPAPTVIQRATQSMSGLGITGVAGGALSALSGILEWLFACHAAGIAATPHVFFLIVTPDKDVITNMSLGIILASHGLKQFVSAIIAGRQRDRRSTDKTRT